MAIRVVLVDDSTLVRKFLSETLSADPDIEVVGAAHNPIIARNMIKQLDPDVAVLDIEMPGMDGLSFLERIMTLRPMPVVMFSSLTQEGSEAALSALALGAVDFIAKPSGHASWSTAAMTLIESIKATASAHVPPLGSELCVRKANTTRRNWPDDRVVAIGASTGGVQALRAILAALPKDCPPILIAQHMPANFIASFVRRLDDGSEISVREVTQDCIAEPGHAYFAVGQRHLQLAKFDGGYKCRLGPGNIPATHVPSVDVLFQSVALAAGSAAMGIVLTGMGRDGARGLSEIARSGGVTAAQDKTTSLIYGMPKAAVDLGAVQFEVSLDRIPEFILAASGRGRQAGGREWAQVC